LCRSCHHHSSLSANDPIHSSAHGRAILDRKCPPNRHNRQGRHGLAQLAPSQPFYVKCPNTTESETAMSTDKLKVLIVDDETALAETMAEALERSGYDVVTAHSGAEGLRILERQEPSVILTDLKMEGMDGLTLLRKAKEDLPDAEVVVITGHGDVKTAVEA